MNIKRESLLRLTAAAGAVVPSDMKNLQTKITRIPVLLLVAVVGVTACDMNGVPNVEGTYTGPVTMTYADLGLIYTFQMRVVVEQSGSRVSMSISFSAQGVTAGVGVATGTIDATGLYTPDEDQSVATAAGSTTCGTTTPLTTRSIIFSGGKLEFAGSAQTSLCGLVSLQATLSR